MSSKVPKIRQANWVSIIPHLIIMGIIIFIWSLINPERAVLFGAITYLLISFSLRKLIPKDHRNGIKKINSEVALNNFKILINKYGFY